MMKILLAGIAMVLFSCNETVKKNNESISLDSIQDYPDPPKKAEPIQSDSVTISEVFSNTRFKGVTVQKTGDNQYTIEGKGQIFEANFSYVVEDGHEELKKGHQMTDAGAPEWGKFKFTIDVPKKRPNSKLTLILFEISAEDGRRVHELPIPLPDK